VQEEKRRAAAEAATKKSPYDGYDESNGKCRKYDKYSYNRNHVYNTKNNPAANVINITQCAQFCNKDPTCKGFQFYLLDPGANDNCMIWTFNDGYTGNGSPTSRCFMKNDTGKFKSLIDQTQPAN